MNNTMHPSTTVPASAHRLGLWFGMLGGAVAWIAHLIGSSLVAEWGCLAGLGEQQLLGLSAVAWIILAFSLVLACLAAAATCVAYRQQRRLRRKPHDAPPQTDGAPPQTTDAFLAQTGLKASGLFVFIIVVETIPILFYLTEC